MSAIDWTILSTKISSMRKFFRSQCCVYNLITPSNKRVNQKIKYNFFKHFFNFLIFDNIVIIVSYFRKRNFIFILKCIKTKKDHLVGKQDGLSFHFYQFNLFLPQYNLLLLQHLLILRQKFLLRVLQWLDFLLNSKLLLHLQ
jgi:hypothetical protein